MKAPQELVDQIKRQEGLRLTAYQDTLGNWSVGYGHTPAFPGQTITEAEAESWLMQDLNSAQTDLLTALPWCFSLSVPRYCVLWNMCFNMGVGHLLEFRLMLEAVRNANYPEAAKQMMNSLWASQVKERAVELAEQMETGHWFNPEM